MRNLLISFFIFVAAISVGANDIQTNGAKAGIWTQDYEAALKLAAEKKLPVMVNFTGSDWCGWCKKMDKEVFSKKEFQEYAAQELVLVHLDFPRDKSLVPEKFQTRNQKLQAEFGVKGYPTFFLLETEDGQGYNIIGRLGAIREGGPKVFIKQINDFTKYSKSKLDSFGKTLKASDRKQLTELRNNHERAIQNMQTWLNTKPQRNEENTKKFTSFKKAIADAASALQSFVKSKS